DPCGAAVDEVEHAFGCVGGGEGGAHGAGGGLGQLGVARVRLDDDGAARGECGGGVAAGHGEREREVRGGEDHHRAEGDVGAAQVRPGSHGPAGVGVVDPCV